MFDQTSNIKREIRGADMKQAQTLWVVSARINPSVENAWNAWYTDVHLPEITKCPGFEAADRYVADAPAGRRYLTIYQVATAEAVSTPEFNQRRGWGPFASDVEAEARLFEQLRK
jgi:antibiotic biosynthesis monooxygenase (ABM) superfamily enzyme